MGGLRNHPARIQKLGIWMAVEDVSPIRFDKDEESSKSKNSRKKFNFGNDIGLVKDDFYYWSKEHLQENSVDLVMTDPQCIDADIFFWEKLAEVSERILKPSGFLVAYCGQKLFDRIVGVLSKYLNYHWMYCVGKNGDEKSIHNGLIEEWQPVLVYYKPPFKKDGISKTMNLDGRQPDREISYFIQMLSSPADIVFDPMMGMGDVIKTAKSLNRKAIGIEKSS